MPVDRKPPGRAKLSYALVSTRRGPADLLQSEFVHAPLADAVVEAAKEFAACDSDEVHDRLQAAIAAYEKGTRNG